MIQEDKIKEWRPEECGTRMGDIVRAEDSLILLKIKCRRCTKTAGVDIFHYAPLDASDIRFSGVAVPLK